MTQINRSILLASSLATASLFGACGSQTDDAYRGKSLMQLTGTVVNEHAEAPKQADVSVIWGVEVEGAEGEQVQAVRVSGEFPASFSLDFFEPPQTDVDVALGMIVVQKFDHESGPVQTAEDLREKDLLGLAEEYVVAYLAHDVADLPGKEYAEVAEILGANAKAGYYLLQVTPAGPGMFDELAMVSSDTPITVRMAPSEELRVPAIFDYANDR